MGRSEYSRLTAQLATFAVAIVVNAMQLVPGAVDCGVAYKGLPERASRSTVSEEVLVAPWTSVNYEKVVCS